MLQPAKKWGAVAQWLERATDNRVRILLRPFGNLGNFLYPTSVNLCVYEDLHGKK